MSSSSTELSAGGHTASLSQYTKSVQQWVIEGLSTEEILRRLGEDLASGRIEHGELQPCNTVIYEIKDDRLYSPTFKCFISDLFEPDPNIKVEGYPEMNYRNKQNILAAEQKIREGAQEVWVASPAHDYNSDHGVLYRYRAEDGKILMDAIDAPKDVNDLMDFVGRMSGKNPQAIFDSGGNLVGMHIVSNDAVSELTKDNIIQTLSSHYSDRESSLIDRYKNLPHEITDSLNYFEKKVQSAMSEIRQMVDMEALSRGDYTSLSKAVESITDELKNYEHRNANTESETKTVELTYQYLANQNITAEIPNRSDVPTQNIPTIDKVLSNQLNFDNSKNFELKNDTIDWYIFNNQASQEHQSPQASQGYHASQVNSFTTRDVDSIKSNPEIGLQLEVGNSSKISFKVNNDKSSTNFASHNIRPVDSFNRSQISGQSRPQNSSPNSSTPRSTNFNDIDVRVSKPEKLITNLEISRLLDPIYRIAHQLSKPQSILNKISPQGWQTWLSLPKPELKDTKNYSNKIISVDVENKHYKVKDVTPQVDAENKKYKAKYVAPKVDVENKSYKAKYITPQVNPRLNALLLNSDKLEISKRNLIREKLPTQDKLANRILNRNLDRLPLLSPLQLRTMQRIIVNRIQNLAISNISRMNAQKITRIILSNSNIAQVFLKLQPKQLAFLLQVSKSALQMILLSNNSQTVKINIQSLKLISVVLASRYQQISKILLDKITQQKLNLNATPSSDLKLIQAKKVILEVLRLIKKTNIDFKAQNSQANTASKKLVIVDPRLRILLMQLLRQGVLDELLASEDDWQLSVIEVRRQRTKREMRFFTNNTKDKLSLLKRNRKIKSSRFISIDSTSSRSAARFDKKIPAKSVQIAASATPNYDLLPSTSVSQHGTNGNKKTRN